MAQINVLSKDTIDKIAAGEVVERPSSVVKELLENAVDAGATAVTVEIKEGGISFIRITDNGCGMDKKEVPKAFLRHATSKIRSAEELSHISSLGFRGEALSSISAVSQMELITKTKQELTGIRYIIEGGLEKEAEEIGAPDGTTIIVRNLFFNTPVRKKFLKQPQTEGSYISDLMEHMAMSRPEISFKYINNGQVRFHTSGNGNLQEIIYRIFGRDISSALIPINTDDGDIHIHGYLGKPEINRSNRNFEIYFVNGRFIKSNIISKAIEEGYKKYVMQHKFPFVVLHFKINAEEIDVNVHPTKMEVRFTEQGKLHDLISEQIEKYLGQTELIPEISLDESKKEIKKEIPAASLPEPFELKRADWAEKAALHIVKEDNPYSIHKEAESDFFVDNRIQPEKKEPDKEVDREVLEDVIIKEPEQLNFFEKKILTKEAREEYRIMGQLFETYWLVAFHDKLFIIDQHAAHEKVKYEKLIKELNNKQVQQQMLNPPLIITLSGREESVLKEYLDIFNDMGFEVEGFGGNSYAVRSVPADLYGCSENRLFLEMLDELADGTPKGTLTVVRERIATMACKAAVKGNMSMTTQEVECLIEQLLALDDPYHCPHGRPTIISMSKYEIEKKFKRII